MVLGLAIFQLLSFTILQSIIFVNLETKTPIYLIIFILGNLFQLVFIIDAVSICCLLISKVIARNTFQVIGFSLFNLVLLMYAAIQLAQYTYESLRPVVIACSAGCIALVIVLEGIYVGLVWKLYKEFGWSIYKNISADYHIICK